jgi:phage terminase large subunit-like protein
MNLHDKYTIVAQMALIESEMERRNSYKIHQYFQDGGPLRRDLYPNALQFFRAGTQFPERLFLGGNRTGKTEAASYELSCHLTGIYPPWWKGKRFDCPIDVWAAGKTATATRDVLQKTLYGELPGSPATGMIPGHLIISASPKPSISNAVETIYVRHVNGGRSMLQFKSFDQGREAFQGTSRHVVWLDEECPEDVYVECLLRTTTVDGCMIVTFTPMEGLTPFVQKWLEEGTMWETIDGKDYIRDAESHVFKTIDEDPEIRKAKEVKHPLHMRVKFIAMVGWDEVPHLSEQAKAQILSSIPPYQRSARTKGIPHLGSGVIYPISEDNIKVAPFEIPSSWPRGYGMDVGWNWTVAIHGAYDKNTQTWYLYRAHWRSHDEPSVHVQGIKAPGDWIPGKIDPAANGRSQKDGESLMQNYKSLGLHLTLARNGVEAGIESMWTKLSSGKLKVFASMGPWFTEYRMYRRDEKGRIVKDNDHLMDATRYLIASGPDWLKTRAESDASKRSAPAESRGGHGWMG